MLVLGTGDLPAKYPPHHFGWARSATGYDLGAECPPERTTPRPRSSPYPARSEDRNRIARTAPSGRRFSLRGNSAGYTRPAIGSATGRSGRSHSLARGRHGLGAWIEIGAKSIPPSAFGRAGVVACPTPLAPLPIFSAQAWPHGALRVASGSFCRLTDECQPVKLLPGSDMPSHPLE
jgi:hypothetical protein